MDNLTKTPGYNDCSIVIKSEDHETSDFSFITEVYQRGHIKPAKYIHSLEISQEIFIELKKARVIDLEFLFIDKTAFFEFKHGRAIISFFHFYICNDMNLRIDNYLLKKAYGENPVKRNAQSKMNADKSIELVQNVPSCKQKAS